MHHNDIPFASLRKFRDDAWRLAPRELLLMSRSYKRGLEFPHEGFVQLCVEQHFSNAGFDLITDGRVDLLCSHPVTGESWNIEAKGQTTQVGLDSRTGLGQLIQAMHSQDVKYGIAVPDTVAFQSQIANLSQWAVTLLRIHWLFVSQDGSVRMMTPDKA